MIRVSFWIEVVLEKLEGIARKIDSIYRKMER